MSFSLFRNLVILLIVSASVDCKPRRNFSDLAEGAEFNETTLQIQKEIAVIDYRYKLYSEGNMPIADESVEKHVVATKGKPGNRVSVPPNCPETMWNNDISWNNDLIVDLDKIAKESPHFLVRMHAIKTLTLMTSRGAMDCAPQKLSELLIVNNAFRDSAPDPELLKNKSAAGGAFACTSLLRCSVALEVALIIGTNYPNADLPQKLITLIRNATDSFELRGYAADVIKYRIDSAEAYVEFMRATQFHDASYRGSAIVLDTATSSALIQKFDALTSKSNPFYDRYVEFIGRPESYEKSSGFAANNIQNYLVKQDLKDKNTSPFDFEGEQEESLNEFTKDIVRPAIDNYRFNLGVRHYVERLSSTDPKEWLDRMRSRVTAGRMIGDETTLSADSGGPNQSRIDQIQRSQNIRAGDVPVDPIAGFMALTTFIDHEVYLPYRSDFRAAIDFVMSQMNREEKLSVYPKAMHVDSLYRAYNEHAKSFGNSVLSVASSDLQLPEQQLKQVDRMRSLFKRLMDIEIDIVRRKDQKGNLSWSGFQSVYHQMNRYSHHMLARGAALNKLVDYSKEDWTTRFGDKFTTQENPFADTARRLSTGSAYADFFLIPVWMRVPVPVLFNPANKGNLLQFDLDHATGDLIGQYLVLECSDRILTKGGRNEKGLVIKNETFFIDDATVINFTCDENWTFADLSAKAFSYGRSTGQEKVEEKLAKAIKDHPLLHTAMMVAMSAVVPHVSAIILRSIALAGRAVTIPLAIRTAWYGRLILWFGRLAIDSFIFGVGDYYFGRSLDYVIGVKLSPEEVAAHSSALFNWKGIATGALIFGIIPFAHGPVDKIVRGIFGPNILGKSLYNRTVQNAIFKSPMGARSVEKLTTKEMTRVGALWFLSTGAQMTTEASIFVFHPMIDEEARKLWDIAKGTYREPGEMEKIWARIHTPTKAEQVLSSALTVTAFTSNRMLGKAVHHSGFDLRMDRQIKFYGINRPSRSYEANRGAFDPFREFSLPKEAQKEQVEAQFATTMEIISKDVQTLKQSGSFSPKTQFIFASEIRRRVLARRMLTGEMDWTTSGTKTDMPELQKYGLDFAVSDRSLDKDPSPKKDDSREVDLWLNTYKKIYAVRSVSGLNPQE